MSAFHNRMLKRRVTSNGSIQIGKHRYYVSRELAGQQVVIRIDGHDRQLVVHHRGQQRKMMPIKDLYRGTISFGDYLELISHEARAEWRQYQWRRRSAA